MSALAYHAPCGLLLQGKCKFIPKKPVITTSGTAQDIYVKSEGGTGGAGSIGAVGVPARGGGGGGAGGAVSIDNAMILSTSGDTSAGSWGLSRGGTGGKGGDDYVGSTDDVG